MRLETVIIIALPDVSLVRPQYTCGLTGGHRDKNRQNGTFCLSLGNIIVNKLEQERKIENR